MKNIYVVGLHLLALGVVLGIFIPTISTTINSTVCSKTQGIITETNNCTQRCYGYNGCYSVGKVGIEYKYDNKEYFELIPIPYLCFNDCCKESMEDMTKYWIYFGDGNKNPTKINHLSLDECEVKPGWVVLSGFIGIILLTYSYYLILRCNDWRKSYNGYSNL